MRKEFIMENTENQVEVMDSKDVEIVQSVDDLVPDVSGSGTGSGNGVAVNAAGAKVTVGVGELNNSRAEGAQISNVQGDINFGDVKQRIARVPPAPEASNSDGKAMSL